MAKSLFSSSEKKVDELIQQFLSFPPHPPPAQPLSDDDYEDQISRLLLLLKGTSNKVLTSTTSGGDLLDILDPSVNTLPYLFALLAHAGLNDNVTKLGGDSILVPGRPLWFKCVLFLESFDARQVRYAGEQWREVIELVAEMARQVGQPIMAIESIRCAILRMDPASSTFTTNHHLFVTLCLEARSYRAALAVLDNDILEFPPFVSQFSHNILPLSINGTSSAYITSNSGISGKINYQHHLEYHLYGAMVYMALKKWARSIEFLSHVITAPASNSVSLIMVEAYRKWLLVGLIHSGKILSLPSNTSTPGTRTYTPSSRAYRGLCEIFQKGDTKKLEDEIEAGQSVWAKDNNTGLVRLVLEAHRRFALLGLQKTYSSLPLPQVMIHVPFGTSVSTATTSAETQTEQLLLSMIASGELNATLSSSSSSPDHPSPTILRFTSSTIQSSPTTQLRKIEDSIQRLQQLNAHIKDTDRKLAMGKENIASLLKAKNAKSTQDASNAASALGSPSATSGTHMAGFGSGAPSSSSAAAGPSSSTGGTRLQGSLYSANTEGAGKAMIMEVDEDIMEGF